LASEALVLFKKLQLDPRLDPSAIILQSWKVKEGWRTGRQWLTLDHTNNSKKNLGYQFSIWASDMFTGPKQTFL
jgi:hypothetical protein